MLLIDTIQSFFNQNNLQLQLEKETSLEEIGSLIIQAGDISKSFSMFIVDSVIYPESNTIRVNFSNWDELYECYTRYMIGYNQHGCN